MEYESLQKKHKLPSIKTLESTFGFEIKGSTSKSREILKKIEEMLEEICEKIQGVLQTDSNLESMYEAHFLSEAEKDDLFRVFKNFMGIRRKIVAAGLDFSEENSCKLIKEAYETFEKNKKTTARIFLIIGKKWIEKSNPISEAAKYFG